MLLLIHFDQTFILFKVDSFAYSLMADLPASWISTSFDWLFR